MVAVFDEGENNIVAGKARGELHRVCPWNVRILHALQYANGTSGLDHASQQQMPASFLNEPPRNEVGLRRIRGGARIHSGLLDLSAHLRRKPSPHQLLGEI